MLIRIFLFVLWAAAHAADADPKCPKNSPEEIGRSYGITWGPVSDRRGIGKEDSCAIMEGLVHYSAACGAPSPLPIDGWKLFHQCPARKTTFGFLQFLAGQTKDPGACRDYFRAVWTRHFRIFSETTFCGVAAQTASTQGRLGDVCPQLEKHLPPGVEGPSSLCLKYFPRGAGDCQKEGACLETLAVDRALRAGQPKTCPEGYLSLCQRKAKQESDPSQRCEKARKDIQGLYCGQYNKAFKRTRGQIGMSDADLKKVDQANQEIQKRRR